MAERRRVHFEGHVQGVGFRYTAVSIARQYPVQGFVQNLSDGQVVVEAEGDSAELDGFFRDLSATMEHQIRNSTVELGLPPGGFTGFVIRY